MSDTEKLDVQFHFQRRGKNKVLVEGKEPPKPVKLYYESLIREGHIHDYAEFATLGHVTRARVTQIMNLRLLAPDLQEQLLTYPRIEQGRDTICLRMFQTIALEPSWKNQREKWKQMNGTGQFASSSFVAG